MFHAVQGLADVVKRVGVASNSHEAIRNVLMGCIDALEDRDTCPSKPPMPR